MNTLSDVIVIGSGPAGVSVSYPLLEAGLQVVMLDGGMQPQFSPPSVDFLDWRRDSDQQWRWMIGNDFHALRMTDAVSPKLRVPGYSYVFSGFEQANQIHTHQGIVIGSLARGGLSNTWGCGVAALSAAELEDFPFPREDLQNAYAKVAQRIGLSGAEDDDLSSYFGVDAWAQPPLPLDPLQRRVMQRYMKRRPGFGDRGFLLGRARLAVLNQNLGEREACNLSGNCLYGCQRRALYSASDDLINLQRLSGFDHHPGLIAHTIGGDAVSPWVVVDHNGRSRQLRTRKVVLAAGTMASTRLALQALRLDRDIKLQSCPTAAFMLWLPLALGQPRHTGFGMGQLSFLQQIDEFNGFGSLFTPTAIPTVEFIRHMPFRRRTAIDSLSALLSSCLVGNLFLPGVLSTTRLKLDAGGTLHVHATHHEQTSSVMQQAEQRLRSAFLRLGCVMLPGSFTLGMPGSDVHYAGSLPMRRKPVLGETNLYGALMGLQDVHVVDGACLPSLSEKSHTLSIMANAHRIGQYIAKELHHNHG